MAFRTLDDLDVKGKRVLVRADLNVPMKDGVVTDALRIERQAPTIRELSGKGAKVIVLSHFDRPKGKVVPSMSLQPVAAALAKELGKPVAFAADCIGPVAQAAVAKLADGEVLLLENTRFHADEEANDAAFAKEIAALGDLFVNDAFSAAHRAHATTEAIAHLLPSAAGRSMEQELRHLNKALGDPERPVLAVIGGAKVSTKIALLENLVKRVETLVIGGAMANTFLAAEGIAVGKSLYEPDHVETARKVLHLANESGAAVLLPVDAVVAKEFKAHARHRTAEVHHVHADEIILDVGAKSIAEFEGRLAGTRTLVWNGPFGAFETPPFDAGTVAAAKLVAAATRAGNLLSVAGGGDTVAALNHAGVGGRLFLRFDRRRRIFGMAGRAGTARRRGPSNPELVAAKTFAKSTRATVSAGIGAARFRRGFLGHDIAELNAIALKMVAKGRGILAADESTGTIAKRFDKIGVTNTEENRRDYRELLFRCPEGMKHVSGVILFDETIRQKAADGTPLVKLIEAAGAVPGIKVDKGAQPLAANPGQTVTEGLDGLRERLVEYHKLGARFAKWRATYDPTKFSHNGINANAHALARYAALCQENGIVPIVEPEVLMDYDNGIDACAEVTEWVLKEVFQQLYYADVQLEGIVLKPNMIVPGVKAAKQASVDEIADRTVQVLKRCVPGAVPGIAFLSGGQSDELATAHLNAMNARHALPWTLTFSYGRALQAAPQKAWSGKKENVAAAQAAFAHRARMNGLAATGEWKAELEKKAA
ncbi:MAG: class I fructose-bisphosphate aldolase [Rhizomicrobium sp.]